MNLRVSFLYVALTVNMVAVQGWDWDTAADAVVIYGCDRA